MNILIIKALFIILLHICNNIAIKLYLKLKLVTKYKNLFKLITFNYIYKFR